MQVRLIAVGPGNDGYAVRLCRSMTRQLGLTGSTTVEVKVGSRKIKARLLQVKSLERHVIGLSRPLLNALGLPRVINLRARADGQMLHLGPIVGILMPGARGLPTPFGSFTLEMAYFIQQGRKAGVLPIAFTCSGIDFQRGMVRGYTLALAEEPRWVRRYLPLPDVVYDHVTVRTRDHSKEVREVRRKLTEAGIPFFNPGFFDKWEAHNWLSTCQELVPHLPETRRISVDELKKTAQKYRRLFIKPARGSLGRNITVLTRAGDGSWVLRRGGRAANKERIAALDSVPGHLPKLDSGTYIIQQGLDLCRSRGRPVDVRVFMQRTGTGRWAVTKMFARVPPSGQLIANISRGAKGRPVSAALARCFAHHRVPGIVRQIRKLALQTCHCLDIAIGKPVGELGVDIGVDNTGHVWIIEVNSKPHRKAYDTLEGMPGARRSFQRPMLYAAYLAGFGEKTPPAREIPEDLPPDEEMNT